MLVGCRDSPPSSVQRAAFIPSGGRNALHVLDSTL